MPVEAREERRVAEEQEKEARAVEREKREMASGNGLRWPQISRTHSVLNWSRFLPSLPFEKGAVLHPLVVLQESNVKVAAIAWDVMLSDSACGGMTRC